MKLKTILTYVTFTAFGLAGLMQNAAAQLVFPDTYKDDTTRDIGFGVNLPPIDTTKRDQVVRAHRYYGWGFRYETSPEMEAKRADAFGLWDTTASVASCMPGETRQEIRHGFVREINFVRALAGTPQIKTESNPVMISTSQEAAVALAANSDVRPFGGHLLPTDSKCFTQKALSGVTNGPNFGSGHALTYLGRSYSLASVVAFLGDAGAGNFWVGHRQSMLEPSTTAIGLAVARSPSTTGIGQNHTITNGGDRSKAWYAYPSPGFFPYRYVPGQSNRWSFSCKDCDFTGATVEMKLNGQALAAPAYESDFLVPAYYKTLVWRPSGVPTYRSGSTGLVPVFGEASRFDGNAEYVTTTADDTYEVTVRNYRQFNTSTGTVETKTTSYTVVAFDPARHEGAVVPAYDFTDLWWDPNENGHGIQITQSIQYESALLFGLWYRYDSAGTGRWVQLSGGTWSDPWTFTGQVYRARGTPALNYSSAGFQPEVIGTFTMRFNSRETMTLTYNTTTEGTIVKNLKRFREGLPKDFTDGKNYTGIYWNPQENGWALTHYYQILFAGWYTYDTNGESRWIILPGATWVSPTEARGPLFRGSGPVSMANYQASQYQASQVGEATLTFQPDGKIRFAYTLDGVSQVKIIEPLGY